MDAFNQALRGKLSVQKIWAAAVQDTGTLHHSFRGLRLPLYGAHMWARLNSAANAAIAVRLCHAGCSTTLTAPASWEAGHRTACRCVLHAHAVELTLTRGLWGSIMKTSPAQRHATAHDLIALWSKFEPNWPSTAKVIVFLVQGVTGHIVLMTPAVTPMSVFSGCRCLVWLPGGVV